MEPPSPYSLFIRNETAVRVPAALLRRAAIATACHHELPPGEINLLLCSNDEIQSLNHRFRALDEPTDVLTFPARKLPRTPRQKKNPLGDLAVSVEFAQKQASFRGATLSDELAYLVIHGVLHLCGFDDENQEDRRKMQIAMAEMGEFLGLERDPEWFSALHALVAAEDAK
jgi:rRNA maturation RNase YbeY